MRSDPLPAGEHRENTLLSVIVPAYNEAATIEELLRRLRMVPLDLQIIVVDDGSCDLTPALLRSAAERGAIELVVHPHNLGKGAAVRSGLGLVRGEVVVVQDADLEYNPADLPRLLDPIDRRVADVVYGSRFLDHHRTIDVWHRLGNRALTMLCNILYGASLTDLETGYKAMRTDIARSLDVRAARWAIDPEVTAKILMQGHSIHEVPISYTPRGFKEGKKITWRDGLVVAATLVRCRFID